MTRKIDPASGEEYYPEQKPRRSWPTPVGVTWFAASVALGYLISQWLT